MRSEGRRWEQREERFGEWGMQGNIYYIVCDSFVTRL